MKENNTLLLIAAILIYVVSIVVMTKVGEVEGNLFPLFIAVAIVVLILQYPLNLLKKSKEARYGSMAGLFVVLFLIALQICRSSDKHKLGKDYFVTFAVVGDVWHTGTFLSPKLHIDAYYNKQKCVFYVKETKKNKELSKGDTILIKYSDANDYSEVYELFPNYDSIHKYIKPVHFVEKNGKDKFKQNQ